VSGAHATRAATGPDAFQHADLAAQVIDGEQRATAFLDRIKSGMAQPEELSVMMTYLRGELRHGFCRMVQKALDARHG
jgi:hypothetical protein